MDNSENAFPNLHGYVKEVCIMYYYLLSPVINQLYAKLQNVKGGRALIKHLSNVSQISPRMWITWGAYYKHNFWDLISVPLH